MFFIENATVSARSVAFLCCAEGAAANFAIEAFFCARAKAVAAFIALASARAVASLALRISDSNLASSSVSELRSSPCAF